jgi:TetR/AcrR family transcriptional repressor of nem operon
MRYPEAHNDTVRARIVAIASRALRKDGLEAVSIPKLMKAAGLTHGGFYVHFKNRDELVAEAVIHAAQDGAFSPDATAKEAFAKYLSKGHVDHPEFGCVIATLGMEGSRQHGKVRKAFAEVARGLIRHVEKRLHPKSEKGALSDEALKHASQMVGAVILARLVQDEELAKRLLESARTSVSC